MGVWGCDFSKEDAYHSVSRALDRKIKFSALIITSQAQSVGAMKAIKDKGFDIPADVAIVDVDSSLVHFQPAITTVDLHPYDLGYLATSLLIENITGKNSKKTKILVPADFVM